ncbi:MAG: PA0069 family radical SAM protein [Alphaproteobacteria bacterium]|nr:PA0069 family radical SAM protein [Alphaproteobacteria bacterium]MCB9929016.1 PA0069 family radical SAM protein [Alphaproteobacteria bacterium]
MSERSPLHPLRGRGAVSNRSGRFEATTRSAVDDGWFQEPENRLPTTVMPDTAKHVITFNQSPDLGFDRTINPYRGCEHGCIYCYARPTHAYWGFSPGQDFETKLFAKFDAAEVLRRELSDPRYKPDFVLLGANTDAYQPIEREHKITRAILGVLLRFRHPVGVVTKSALVVRDADLWAELAALGLGHVTISVTTLDRRLARAMEPRASTPGRRLEAIRALAEAGVPVCVNVAPIIPGLTDHEIEPILEAARDAGAREAAYTLLRLPLEIKDLFREWLAEHYPDRAGKVESLVRQTRGGALYNSGFGERMRGTGPYADLIRQRFRQAAQRFGLDRRAADLRTDLFAPPPAPGQQLQLAL